jgi:hypothetical protein
VNLGLCSSQTTGNVNGRIFETDLLLYSCIIGTFGSALNDGLRDLTVRESEILKLTGTVDVGDTLYDKARGAKEEQGVGENSQWLPQRGG